MHKVDSKIRETLWEKDGDQIRWAASAFVRGGVARQKGKTQKESLEAAVLDIIKIAYLGGLDRGYDMGMHVASGEPEQPDSVRNDEDAGG